MFVYFAIFFLLALSAYLYPQLNPRSKHILELLWVFFLALFAGVRNGVGSDFYTYQEMFDNELYLWEGGVAAHLFQTEFLYHLIGSCVKSCGLGYNVFLFIISLLSLSILSVAIRRIAPELFLFVLLVYFCFFYTQHQLNVMRHGLAMGCIWLAFSFIPERRFKSFLLSILLGAGFHFVSFAALPFYFLLGRHISRISMLAMFLFCLCFGLFFDVEMLSSILPKKGYVYSKFEYYFLIKNFKTTFGSIFTPGLVLNIIFFCFLLRFRELSNSPSMNLVLNALFFFLIGIFLFAKDILLKERIVGMFLYFELFTIPYIYSHFDRTLLRSQRFIVKALVCALCLLSLYGTLIRVDPHQHFVPFKTFLETPVPR